MTARTCIDCPTQIGPQSKTGRCHRCAMRATAVNPKWRARQRAGIAAKFAEPAHRALHAERLRERNRNAPPALKAAMRENGRKAATDHGFNQPAVKARLNDPALRAENGRKGSETKMAHIPPAYRDAYRELTASKRMRAADALVMIEAQIAADEKRAKAAADAATTPFERQLARVAAGAKLTTRFVPRRVDPLFTLGGVASEAM